MNESKEIKTIKGPKAAVATFVRPSDQKRIFVFTKRGESVDAAIVRVMQRNGAAGGEYAKCN
jgi:hypothetical protein